MIKVIYDTLAMGPVVTEDTVMFKSEQIADALIKAEEDKTSA